MVAYGMGILPLIRELRKAHPGVNQPWYADDTRAGGTFRGIRQHLDDLMVRRDPTGLLPGAEQEHLGHVSPESPVGEGLLPGLRPQDSDGNPRPWGFSQDQGGAGLLAGVEGGRLAGFGGHFYQGGVSAPVERIHGPAEFPSSGVGLRETRHPRHWDGLPGGGGHAAENLPPGYLSVGHVSYTRERYHWSAVQIVQDFPPQPDSDRGGELDGILHDHRAPCCGAPRDGKFQVGISCPPDGEGERQDTIETCRRVRDQPGRGPGRLFEAGCMPAGEDSADRVVAVGAPL